ncbi:hypothetical protein MSAN_01380500 [Mycena sanguinolenta]|uniref:Uncharacterized protein n=1 Tax=Mycena sanguinolenta TaxID=230812 RepID=A0A8H6Y7I8_9AGAR|nr:hypothetical protein MSAN_01380500 [Mycena sanguinolenta]
MKPSISNSTNFMKLYESLPPEAQRSLVENKLAPLLDLVPKDRAKKVIKSVQYLESKYGGIPTLDLKGKKRELYGLLDELSRDSKRAIVRERSNREELLVEIVDSMLNWLNDIWTVVYEYNAHFDDAHSCLLFVAEVLNTLKSIPRMGGHCRCTIAYPPVNLAIRRKGKIIKQFNLAEPRNIDRALLWIWRDLFVSMFAEGIDTKKIPGMLSDIEELLGWEALERLLSGGFNRLQTSMTTTATKTSKIYSWMTAAWMGEVTDDEEDDWRCSCRLHASHWTDNINMQRHKLRDLVHQHLVTLFELTPSHKLFLSILSINPDSEEIEEELFETLSQIAGSSADTLVAALEIYGSEGHAPELVTLLDEHAYLLRPRDAYILQTAVGVLSEFGPFHARAVEIAEKEIFDSVAAIRAAARTAFRRVEEKPLRDTLVEIMKLRSDNPQRQHRIEAWVDSVMTRGSAASHPMAFAAMIMGFPLAGGMEDSDDMDMLGFIDSDPRDPDFEDLREEFRPKLRDRFEGWVSTVSVMKGGNIMLGKLYLKIVEEMPYFKANDIAEEMLNRLNDSPSKAHITDGFDAVLSFCKSQRKKLSMRAEKRRKNEAAKKAATTPATAASTPQRAGPLPSPAVGPTPGPSSLPGGMNDVD